MTASVYVDNRDIESVTEYMEDRIEFMKRRIRELTEENEQLKLAASKEQS